MSGQQEVSGRGLDLAEEAAASRRVDWARQSRARRAHVAGRRLRGALRDPAVAVPAGLLLLIVLACFLGPWVFGLPSPTVGNLHDYLLPIGSRHHLLGTNALGNDLLSRMLHGGQVSLTVGVSATVIGMLIGVAIGTAAGFYGGFVESVLMRVLDMLFAFPNLVLALAIAAYLRPSVTHTIWAISAFSVAGFGRVSRGQTVRLRNLDYIVAARSTGVAGWKIIIGHVLPNIAGPTIAFALVSVGHAMVVEAGLSFLGLGIPIPQPSWGNLIASAQEHLDRAPLQLVMPAAALFVTILCINLLTDAVRRRLALSRQ